MIESLLENTREASYSLPLLSQEAVDNALLTLADAISENSQMLLEANAKDLSQMDPESAMYDRLKLTEARLSAIADDMRKVVSLESPVGKLIDSTVRPNGMTLRRVSVPFGVIGVIFEARPNVCFDVFSLCLKSRNACVLKGGSDAHESNCAIVSLIKDTLSKCGICPDVVALLPKGHDAASELMRANAYVDLLIPRGSAGLIRRVRENSTVPVIETGAGVCHTYFDKDADLAKGSAVIVNAKTRRVSVCNALDCLVIHKDRLSDLPSICNGLCEKGVVIEADQKSYEVLAPVYPKELLLNATEESFGHEFLALRMSIKTVESFGEALSHIRKYSSRHSECIVTENRDTAQVFQASVDAACVYVNVSTAFTDGAQFGLGAEIGISTQKLHARGPMALRELTTYKWLIDGEGQIRTP